MARISLSDRSRQVVICFDSGTELLTRLRRIVNGQDRIELKVARAAYAAADILTCCRHPIPVLLVTEDKLLGTLPFYDLGGLITQRDLRILVFSAKTDDSSYDNFFRQGCAGVLPPDAADTTVRRAIQAAFEGELWLPRRVLSRLALAGAAAAAGPKLTKREGEILSLIRSGLSNQQIAERLFISRETVRWHIRSLYSKLGEAKQIAAARTGKKDRGEDGPRAGRPPGDAHPG
jgi:DNA-binding NarL/FixJ family response regulator